MSESQTREDGTIVNNGKDAKTSRLIAIGYISAIILAFSGLLTAGAYLFYFSIKSPPPNEWNVQTMVALSAERRMVLLSTAIFVALSFSCMAFALFLIQAKGDVTASGNIGNYKITLSKLSPGLFVFLCATLIILFASTFRIDYGLTSTTQGGDRIYEKSTTDSSKMQEGYPYDSSKGEYK
jgi:hypothetical protein